MTRLDRLNSFLSERLSAALNEIIYTVSLTMKEYEEETARIRKENEHLKEMLKIAGCSVKEANPGVGFSLSTGQNDSNLRLEQQSEPPESQSGLSGPKEKHLSVKAEQPFYPVQPETKQTCGIQPEKSKEPLQSTSLLNPQTLEQTMTEFPAKIKVEAETTDSESETTDSESGSTNSDSDTSDDTDSTDSTDSSNQSISPQDMNSEKSNQGRQHKTASQRPSAHSAESASHTRPVEFQAVFSYSNQIACNNKCRSDSRQCKMHKAIGKSSPVWKYFSLKEGDCSKAVCLICKTEISRGIKEYKTSALLRHLRLKHGKC